MRRTFTLPALAAAALLAGGCERTATAPSDAALTSADVSLLAEELDALAGVVLASQLGVLAQHSSHSTGADAVPLERSFDSTRGCPAGGTVRMAGTTRGEIDRESRSLSLETSATKTHTACAFPARRSGGATLTVDGNPNVAVKSSVKVVAGQPSGPQTTTQKGGFSWSASDGRSGSCTLDLVSTLDPAARTHTLKGTMCGRPVDVTRQAGAPRR